MSAIYSKSPDVVFRKIADEFILVPIKQKAADLQCIYTLNESAAFIWELIDGTSSGSQMKDRLTKEFDVDSNQAGSDIDDLLSEFEALSFIRKT